jgi:hypothetical protein
MRCAKFYNLTFLYKWSSEFESVSNEHEEEYNQIIRNHLRTHSVIKDGDIIFIGSTFHTLQEYGFAIVKNGDFVSGYEPHIGTVTGVTYADAIQELNVFWKSFCGGDAYYDEGDFEYFKKKGTWN